jgi:uncharacterized protein YgiM (DUF1202 family)
LFDVSKILKGVKILNGNVGEEAAKYQAKAIAEQLRSEKAHVQYHMIQHLHTDVDITETELLTRQYGSPNTIIREKDNLSH